MISQYNSFNNLGSIPYNIIAKLITDNDMIWKLLYYNTSDAWTKPNLTAQQKGGMVYSGQSDTTPFKVFMDCFSPDDVQDTQITNLRIFPTFVLPENRIYSTVDFTFEIVSHQKISMLSNYQPRCLMIFDELMKCLDGAEVGGLGRLSFDRNGHSTNIAKYVSYNNRNYKGYIAVLSTRTT